jgi:hypothetical protein
MEQAAHEWSGASVSTIGQNPGGGWSSPALLPSNSKEDESTGGVLEGVIFAGGRLLPWQLGEKSLHVAKTQWFPMSLSWKEGKDGFTHH